ncbi:MAG: response regulator, partial [Sulfuricurvum sp.]|nr:response regulator [Sulfuricurvum sp.]
MSSDEFLFAAEEASETVHNDPWIILIVDDDLEVHSITKLALHDFVYDRRKLLFLSAYSAAEATSAFETRSDIALVLLDVVMETDTAGLDLVKVIRERFKNDQIRIIIRTGQPGMSPERYVIDHY